MMADNVIETKEKETHGKHCACKDGKTRETDNEYKRFNRV